LKNDFMKIIVSLVVSGVFCLSIATIHAADIRQLSPTRKTTTLKRLRMTPSAVVPSVQTVTPGDPSLIPGGKPVTVTLSGSNLNLITSVQVISDDEAVPHITVQLGDPVFTSRQVTVSAQAEAPTGRYQIRLLAGSNSIDLNTEVVSVIVSGPPFQSPTSGVIAGKTARGISPARDMESTGLLAQRSGAVADRSTGRLPDSKPSGTVMIDTVPLPEKPASALPTSRLPGSDKAGTLKIDTVPVPEKTVSGPRMITPETTPTEKGEGTEVQPLRAPGSWTDTGDAKQYAATGAEPRDAAGKTTTGPSPVTTSLLDKATPYSASKYSAATKATEAPSISKYDYSTERSDVPGSDATLSSTAQTVAKPSIGPGIDEGLAYRRIERFDRKIDSILNSAPQRGRGDPETQSREEIPVHYRPKNYAKFSVKLAGDTSFTREAEFSSEDIASTLPGNKAHLYFPSSHAAQIKLETTLDLEIIYPKVVVPGEVIKLYPKIILEQPDGSITDVLQVNTQVEYDFGIKFLETEEGSMAFNTKDVAFLPPGLLSGSKTVIPEPGQVFINQSPAETVVFRISSETVDAWHFPKKDIVHYVPSSTVIDPFYDLYIEADYTVTHDAADNIKVVSYGYSFDNDPPDSNTVAVSSSTPPVMIKIPDNRGLKAGDVLTMHFDKVVFDSVFEYKVIVDGNAAYYGEFCALVYTGCTEFARVDIPMNSKTIGNWTEAERITTPVPRMGLPSNLAGSISSDSALRFEIVDSVAGYTD